MKYRCFFLPFFWTIWDLLLWIWNCGLASVHGGSSSFSQLLRRRSRTPLNGLGHSKHQVLFSVTICRFKKSNAIRMNETGIWRIQLNFLEVRNSSIPKFINWFLVSCMYIYTSCQHCSGWKHPVIAGIAGSRVFQFPHRKFNKHCEFGGVKLWGCWVWI